MCNCGCNTCETKGPLLTEGKVKSLLSEGLQYHIDKKIPLFETIYRIGSDKHLALIKEARKMYSRNVIDLCEDDEALIKTHLGEFALYEGEPVPLDLPMLEESNMPSQEEVNKFFSDTQQEIHYLNNKPVKDWDEYDMSNWKSKLRKKELGRPQFGESLKEQMDIFDDIANEEFGMDYDQLGSGEKEWVRDEIDNMSMNESDSNYPDFDLNKNIRYQDTSISSGMWRYTGKEQGGKGVYRNLNNGQILAFDRSDFDIFRKNLSSHFDISESINENEDKLLKIKQELEALRPGTISWIDDIFISSYDGSLQVELDYTLYPDEIKQLAQIAAKYGMELKYMTGKNATLVKRRIDEAIKKALSEKEGVPHYTKDGKEWKGKVHKMPDGSLMSGNPHDKNGSGPNGESEKLYHKEDLSEAEFKGKEVSLNKPKRGGPKAYYVYVKDGDKVKKVTFGSGGLRAKIKNKEARNAFAARHNCKDKKDRTKAGYWSCNLPRYASALGLGANMNTFW
jgi:hypothetical protein